MDTLNINLDRIADDLPARREIVRRHGGGCAVAWREPQSLIVGEKSKL
jgi:hypothetical protein